MISEQEFVVLEFQLFVYFAGVRPFLSGRQKIISLFADLHAIIGHL